MKKNLSLLLAGGAALLTVPVLMLSGEQAAPAADHLDPPTRTDPAMDSTPDRPADIADIYAWHTDTSVILAVDFAGPQGTDLPATYDPDVLYTINVSNDGNRTTPNFPIRIRFGEDRDNAGKYGVQVSGVPGVTGNIEGPVESELNQDGVKVYAGLFDDPFFFDLQGFRDTVNTGTLSFDNTRDFFAGQNITAVIIEIPRSRIENGDNVIDVWSDTARFGGNL